MRAAARLRSADLAQQLDAMADLVEHGETEADDLEALAECLGAARTIVQRRAAETFAALAQRGIEVRRCLCTAVQSPAPKQRWGAAYAMSLIGQPPPLALPALLEALGSTDADVRWAAGNILARMRESSDVGKVLRAVLATGTPLQRKMAAYCLRALELRCRDNEQAIVAALDDADPSVRRAAVSCLPRVATNRPAAAQRLVELLGDSDVSVRRIAAAVLGPLGERSAAVVAALRAATTTTDVSLQRAAERSLRMLCQ